MFSISRTHRYSQGKVYGRVEFERVKKYTPANILLFRNTSQEEIDFINGEAPVGLLSLYESFEGHLDFSNIFPVCKEVDIFIEPKEEISSYSFYFYLNQLKFIISKLNVVSSFFKKTPKFLSLSLIRCDNLVHLSIEMAEHTKYDVQIFTCCATIKSLKFFKYSLGLGTSNKYIEFSSTNLANLIPTNSIRRSLRLMEVFVPLELKCALLSLPISQNPQVFKFFFAEVEKTGIDIFSSWREKYMSMINRIMNQSSFLTVANSVNNRGFSKI